LNSVAASLLGELADILIKKSCAFAFAVWADCFELDLLADLWGDPLLELQDGASVARELKAALVFAEPLFRVLRLVRSSAIIASAAGKV
jgi:hypothetical protein